MREAESAAQFKEEEAQRLAGLFKEGVIAEMEVLRVRSEARSRRAEVESLQHTVSRLERQQRTEESERRVRIDKLLREKTELEGQRATTAATISRLQNEIERRTIRAPASGQLGEVTTSKEGAVVSAGDKLGTVVPSAGSLKIVAEFPPSSARARARRAGRADAPREFSMDAVRQPFRRSSRASRASRATAKSESSFPSVPTRLRPSHSNTDCPAWSRSRSSRSRPRRSCCAPSSSSRHHLQKKAYGAQADALQTLRAQAPLRAGGRPDLFDGLRPGRR